MQGIAGFQHFEMILKSVLGEFFHVKCDEGTGARLLLEDAATPSLRVPVGEFSCSWLLSLLNNFQNMTVVRGIAMLSNATELASYRCAFGPVFDPPLTHAAAVLLSNGSAPFSPAGTELVSTFTGADRQCTAIPADVSKNLTTLFIILGVIAAAVCLCFVAGGVAASKCRGTARTHSDSRPEEAEEAFIASAFGTAARAPTETTALTATGPRR